MGIKKSKLIVILGPTASGKSDLAVWLAKKFKGEVISADSRQVYTGLDIGSGKITKKEMGGIKHHLLDVADPKKVFSVAQYQKLATKSINDILQRGKLPIICGGTGLYIDSIIDGISLPQVGPNQKLRRELAKKTTKELLEILKKIDPNRAENIDIHNPVRLIRAIEIAEAIGSVPTIKKVNKFDCLKIGLNPGMEILKKNITVRLHKRLKKGMVMEVKNLHHQGVSWKRLDGLGLEYRYLALFLQGKITEEEMVRSIEKESLKYAKRQMTWFKRDKQIYWIESSAQLQKIEKNVSIFLETKTAH